MAGSEGGIIVRAPNVNREFLFTKFHGCYMRVSLLLGVDCIYINFHNVH